MSNGKLRGRIETLFTLLSPMSHIGSSHGPDSYLDTQDILGPEGLPTEVFVYHGNAWRGQLRDCGSKYLLDALGRSETLRVPLKIFYLLFSGGSIGGDQSIDIDQALRIREALPLVSVFGGGVGNQLLPGKMAVGDAYPLCAEVQHLLPESLRNLDAVSWRQMTTERSHSRKDDAKDSNLSVYVQSTEDAKLIEAVKDGDQTGRDPGDTPKSRSSKKEESKPQQMRYTMECLSAGARLYQSTDLLGFTELEFGALASALHEWSSAPYLGGQNRIGFGRVSLVSTWAPFGSEREELLLQVDGNRPTLGPTAEAAKQAYDAYLQRYTEYLDSDREGLVRAIEGVAR